MGQRIKFILTDVDGVLTDGRIQLDTLGNETKSICYRDLDAIGVGRRAGYEFAFATGESGPMVERLAKRFSINIVYENAKDKLKALEDFCNSNKCLKEEVVYIGDSDRDVPALLHARLSFAPCDASEKALQAATYTTKSAGGYGVLLEVVNGLMEDKYLL